MWGRVETWHGLKGAGMGLNDPCWNMCRRLLLQELADSEALLWKPKEGRNGILNDALKNMCNWQRHLILGSDIRMNWNINLPKRI